MKRTRLISLLLAVGLLAGCGGGNTGAPEGETQVNDGGAANEEEGDAEDPAQPQPAELENFTSGILYEEGEYLFEIDSMEMTEDAYVITYHAGNRRAELFHLLRHGADRQRREVPFRRLYLC